MVFSLIGNYDISQSCNILQMGKIIYYTKDIVSVPPCLRNLLGCFFIKKTTETTRRFLGGLKNNNIFLNDFEYSYFDVSVVKWIHS